ncbi:MAG: formate dehydrogenase accessory sulfurtransferase FdhD, partial [Anaerolineae bacterium]
NSLDKIQGQCLLEGIDTRDRILLTTGRLSVEMLNKAAQMQVPVLVSRTSPTDLAVELAKAWGHHPHRVCPWRAHACLQR